MCRIMELLQKCKQLLILTILLLKKWIKSFNNLDENNKDAKTDVENIDIN